MMNTDAMLGSRMAVKVLISVSLAIITNSGTMIAANGIDSVNNSTANTLSRVFEGNISKA